jgi:hypothetical protein
VDKSQVHTVIEALPQLAVMSAIVATLFYWPAGIAAALVLAVLGIPFTTVATFGGAFNTFVGLIAWWLLAFAGACAYAACAFPWGDKVLAWPRKK